MKSGFDEKRDGSRTGFRLFFRNVGKGDGRNMRICVRKRISVLLGIVVVAMISSAFEIFPVMWMRTSTTSTQSPLAFVEPVRTFSNARNERRKREIVASAFFHARLTTITSSMRTRNSVAITTRLSTVGIESPLNHL